MNKATNLVLATLGGLAVVWLFVNAGTAIAERGQRGYVESGLQLSGGTLTGIVYHPDGTPPLPSVSFADDPDTGIYRSGSNQLGFSAGSVGQSVPRMRLSSSVLDVYGSTVYSSSGPIEIGSACTTGATGGGCAGGPFAFESTVNLSHGTALPGTCATGQYFQDTDSDDCANTGGGDGAVCVCKTTNTWALVQNI